jgi:hypothetical protein
MEMRLANVMSRLNRIYTITGKNVYSIWLKNVQRRCKAKYINKRLNPTYITISEEVCQGLEEDNSIYNSVFRVEEIKKDINKSYVVRAYTSNKFLDWFFDKATNFAETCRINKEKSIEILYNAFIRHINTHPCAVIGDRDRLSGTYDQDIFIVLKDNWLRNILTSVVIAATIGSV